MKTRTTAQRFLAGALALVLVTAFAAAFALAAGERLPVVTAVSPQNDAKNVPLDTVVTVTFSEDMDAASINAGTFLLRQRTTPETGDGRSLSLQGTVSYDRETRTATLRPNDPIWADQAHGNVYTAAITTDVTDDAGNPLEHEYIWSFTVGTIAYKTGPTTSQQNETASLVTPSQAVPPAAPPAQGSIASPSVPWWLSPYALIGASILILAAIVLLAYLLLRKRSVPRTAGRSRRKDPFGDVHPVGDIEGIGPKYAKRLGALNIETTKQLWKADAAKVASHLGVGMMTVQHWQQMAELMAVKGIGPQYAELLERSGVGSIEALAAWDPDALLKQVQAKQDSIDMNIQGNPPGQATVAGWIDAANDHQARVDAKGEI